MSPLAHALAVLDALTNPATPEQLAADERAAQRDRFWWLVCACLWVCVTLVALEGVGS